MLLTDIWPTLGQHEPSGTRKNAHPTKRGPGRTSGHSVKHGSKPKPPKGAWSGQRTNRRKNEQRAIKARIGARQYRLLRKAQKREGSRS